MAKYRKKPVIIEAFQYDGDLIDNNGDYYVPKWFIEANFDRILYYDEFEGRPGELFIRTLEGNHHVSIGDYIIQGVNGELYPCKSDIFEQTYELADKEVIETAKAVVDTINKMQRQTLACSSALNI